MGTFNDLMYGGPRWSMYTRAPRIAPLIIAAGIAAGGSLLSSFIGAGASGDASAQNAAFNQLNFNAAERERLQQLFAAMKAEGRSDLGTTDVFGTRTQFVPGEGIVATAGPEIQRIIDASNFEQEQQLTGDAAGARMVRDTSRDRALDSNLTSQALMQEFLRRTPSSTTDIQSVLDLDTSRGFNEGADRAQNAGFINALRQGAGSDFFSDAIAQLGDRRGEALTSALSGNRQRAEGIKASRDDRSGTANLLNLFSAQASGAASGPPAPSTAGQSANAGIGLQANRNAQINALLANAAGKVGGRFDFTTPDFSNATAVGGGAEALSSLFSLFLSKPPGLNPDRGASSPGGFGT